MGLGIVRRVIVNHFSLWRHLNPLGFPVKIFRDFSADLQPMGLFHFLLCSHYISTKLDLLMFSLLPLCPPNLCALVCTLFSWSEPPLQSGGTMGDLFSKIFIKLPPLIPEELSFMLWVCTNLIMGKIYNIYFWTFTKLYRPHSNPTSSLMPPLILTIQKGLPTCILIAFSALIMFCLTLV